MQSSMEDDPVIFEGDIFLDVPPNDSELNILQFPLRPKNFPIDEERPVVSCRFQEFTRRIQLELSLKVKDNTSSMRYDPDIFDEDKIDDFTAAMEIQKLSSDSISALNSNFCVGFILGITDQDEKDEDKIVAMDFGSSGSSVVMLLIPLHGIMQMRPDFEYIDRRNAQRRQAAALSKVDLNPEDDEDDGDLGVELGVSFRKKESERAAHRRKNSFMYIEQVQSKYKWRDAQYYNAHSDQAKHALDSMKSYFTDTNVIQRQGQDMELKDQKLRKKVLGLSKRQYLKKIAPQTNETTPDQNVVSGTSDPFNVITMSDIAAMPLEERIVSTLRRIEVASHSYLSYLCNIDPADSTMISKIENVAIILRQKWLIRSEQIPSISSRMSSIRDLCANCFRSEAIVASSTLDRILEPYMISVENVSHILGRFADHTKGIGWKLKESLVDDYNFDVKFLAQHDSKWDQVVKNAKTSLKSAQTARLSDEKTFSLRISKWIRHQFRVYGVLSVHTLQKEWKNSSLGTLHTETQKVFEKQVVPELETLSVNIRGIYILKTTENPSIDKFRDVILEMFKENETLKRQETKERFLEKLDEDITDANFLKIMREIATSKGAKWTLKGASLNEGDLVETKK